jgi:hypothetical protein
MLAHEGEWRIVGVVYSPRDVILTRTPTPLRAPTQSIPSMIAPEFEIPEPGRCQITARPRPHLWGLGCGVHRGPCALVAVVPFPVPIPAGASERPSATLPAGPAGVSAG